MVKGRAYPITVSSSAGNAPGVLCTTWLGGQRYLSEKIYLTSGENAPGGPLYHMAGETTLSCWKLTQMLLTGGPLQLGLTG